MKQYDYLIVGAGLFGAVFAYEASKHGKKCLVIDRRSHIGGNCYCEKIEGINVHKYGAHIFHTSNKEVWEYVNQFSDFNHFVLNVVANYQGETYSLPFNMNTFSKMWGVTYPYEAEQIIEDQIKDSKFDNPQNLEEKAISLVGKDVFNKLIKEYVEKQWGRDCKNLPAFIIQRLPFRLTYNNNYYNDIYQGIPINGYNVIFEKMLESSDVMLSTSFVDMKDLVDVTYDKVIYTGAIDEYYNYCFGSLEYRSVRFEEKIFDTDNYQGTAVMSYTDHTVPYTRTIEHKHFEFGKQKKTIVSFEFSQEWKKGTEPYYPINNNKNMNLLNKYKQLAEKEKKVIFGGRLGEYKYYDMDKVILAALNLCKTELK